VGDFVGVEAGEEGAGGGFEAAERLGVESENGRDTAEELLAGGAGFLGALVAEGGAGVDAGGGELVGEDRDVGGGHAGPTDEHDGDDGDDKDESCDDAGAVEESAGGGERGVRTGAMSGRRLTRVAGVEAAEEEFELIADGHGRE
jgi:hypothetical protein